MRFNNFELKAPSSYGPIPVGNYDAQVSSCEWKENSQHTGEIIAVKYTIIGPTHNNRIVFSNFNIRNSSAKAEEIGQQQFSDFTRACGFDVMPDDTDMYLGKVLNIRIGIRATSVPAVILILPPTNTHVMEVESLPRVIVPVPPSLKSMVLVSLPIGFPDRS